MAATGLHISISAEKVFSVGPLDISNSILTSLVVSGLLITFALLVKASLRKTDRPSGLQNFAEMLVEGLKGLVDSVTNSPHKTAEFLPLVATFFLVILLNNWLGLVPGVGTIGFMEEAGAAHAQLQSSTVAITTPIAQASTTPVETEVHAAETAVEVGTQPAAEHTAQAETAEHAESAEKASVFVPYFRAGTADLNTTLALAAISVFMTQVFGVMHLKLGYFSKFINFSSPLSFLIGLLETVLEFAKILSFAFRLFGNVFAGEVLLAVITFLVPVVVPMPFYGLEVAVGAIQALVFAMLSVVFFSMATTSHESH